MSGSRLFKPPALPEVSDFDLGSKGDLAQVWLFSALAVAILLLACVNYVNLAVALSIRRTREVGMRKAVGAEVRQLLGQFLCESLLMAGAALALALWLVQLLLPAFGGLMARPLQLDSVPIGLLVPGLVTLVVVVGLLAGSYPALYMARRQPLQVLKGTGAGRRRGWALQHLLIVAQYAACIGLLVASLAIYEQLRFIRETDSGYRRENVISVTLRDDEVKEEWTALREALLENPQVLGVTGVESLPTSIESLSRFGGPIGNRTDGMDIYRDKVDHDFLEVFGIGLVAGRGFTPGIAGDAWGPCLLNETAVRAMGWTAEEAIGKRFGEDYGGYTVIGVVKDFHLHSMRLPIEPLQLVPRKVAPQFLAVRVRPEDLSGTIAFLERTVKRFSTYPFDYQFLDDRFDALYRNDLRLGQTLGSFTVLALLVAWLGLFGLAALTVEQRTKEVGIRKVLGATTGSILVLLSKDFLRPVAVAAAIAAPLAYLAVHRWLQGFAYRIEPGPQVLAVTGVLVLAAASLAVISQALRAGLANPVDSLRYE